MLDSTSAAGRSDEPSSGVTVFGDLHVTGTLTADGRLQIAQSAMTGNVTDTAAIGVDTVLHLLHRRIDDLAARIAALEASSEKSLPSSAKTAGKFTHARPR